VSPTAITTGPTPELPDDDPALAMICRPDIASRYRWLDVTSPRSSRDQANRSDSVGASPARPARFS
jgi:hypothetical protein